MVKFSFGDRVVHGAKPEWGVGQIVGLQPILQDGVPAQRLTIRFERAGLKTLSTGFADLRPAGAPGPAGAVAAESAEALTTPGRGWLADLESQQADPVQVMSRLPAAATDPFSTVEARLRATLDLYRYTASGRPLMDWAAAQSGLADPLTRFNRQELEQLFRRFEIERDAHLRRLVFEARRQDPGAIARAVASAPPAAQQAVRRFDA